jgi:hypothetical protein
LKEQAENNDYRLLLICFSIIYLLIKNLTDAANTIEIKSIHIEILISLITQKIVKDEKNIPAAKYAKDTLVWLIL